MDASASSSSSSRASTQRVGARARTPPLRFDTDTPKQQSAAPQLLLNPEPQADADEPFKRAPTPEELKRALLANRNYRQVLYTYRNDAEDTLVYKGDFQMVAMSLGMRADDANLEFGLERHDFNMQYFAVASVSGVAKALMRQEGDSAAVEFTLSADSKWTVPPHTLHNVYVEAGSTLQVLTIYTPPHHPRGTVDKTRADAEYREQTHATCFVCGAVATRRFTCGLPLYACTKQHEALCRLREYMRPE